MYIWLFYAFLGAFSGVMAGLLGIGGGLIIVPGLIWVFQSYGFSEHILTQLAIGTSLGSIVLTSIASSYGHHRAKAVNWPLVKTLSIGIVLGAIIGAVIADQVRGAVLQSLIGIFAWVMAIKMGFDLKPKGGHVMPGKAGQIAAAGVIGAVSSLFGIGGGALMVPYLTWCGLKIQQAVGASAATGFTLAVSGALSYMIVGWHHAELPAWSSGYIYWPALFGITTMSIFFAQLGAWLAHQIKGSTLKHIFAVFLVFVGGKLLWAALVH